MLTALITGAAGFCAGHLARRIRKLDSVRILGADFREDQVPDAEFDQYSRIDIRDPQQVDELVRKSKPDWVFHLAGASTGKAVGLYQTNLIGTVNLMEAVHEYVPDARVLLVGSAAEYGHVDEPALPVTEDHPCNPSGAYGVSKHAAVLVGQDYARRLRSKVVIARPFNIVGAGVPSSLVVGAVLERARHALSDDREPVVKVGNLDTVRDYVAVEDVVESYVRMIQGSFWGEVFNVCSGRPTSTHDVVTSLLRNSKRPIRVEVDPALVRTADVPTLYGSNKKLIQSLAFEPRTDLESALRSTWQQEMEGLA